ncbi:TAFII55 protein conserved region-domain-containing protein [Phaeosphaeriaceae sp. PMI808]|nr:TAFII55 protein conserved region-domain-containing protein [Phaeosphaeriaceae sp. PMI808]
MKLKLKTSGAAASNAPSPAPSPAPQPQDEATAPAPTKPGKLKLSIKSVAPSAGDGQKGDAPTKKPPRKPKQKKLDEDGNPIAPTKSGPKKRAREDGDNADTRAPKRKPKPTAKSLAMANDSGDEDELMAPEPAPAFTRPQPTRNPSLKLSIKASKGNAPGALQRTSTAILKVKGAGKAPVRPYGVGYDSEADEAEQDPAIESQFILRMLPGPDCDLLRKSIEDRTIGQSMSQGGPGVYYRFFDREGRRAMVTIQGRNYAASMVELPTVIETMKSWNKKDWVKTADVCQMLLVLGRVQNEDEAKKYPRPNYVEPDSHRFPHGLTPPMRWARKLRFRPRKSYLDVERAEAQMNRLLQEDASAASAKYDLVDSDHESSSGESDSGDEVEEDEEMMNAPHVIETPIEEVDAGDLEQMLQEGLMEDDDIEIQADDQTLSVLFGGENIGAEPATPATAHDVALHALNQNGTITLETETAASTPAAATSADDDDDDDDDDADSDDGDDVDDAAVAEEQRKEQLRAEIAELDKAIQANMEARDRQTNQIFKKRMQTNIDKQKADREIKRKQLDEDIDE